MKRFCRLFIFLIVLSNWIPHLAAEVVNMPDASLAAVVRAELRLAPDVSITREALQRLTRLHDYRSSWTRSSIKDLTGLEHAIGLNSVFLTHHKISDLGPLKGLPIWSLYISRNPINDFSPLAGLRQLRTLSVSVTSVAVMNNLRRHVDLTQLQRLHIDGERNRIGDLRPFANLTQLESFAFSFAQIRDVTPLAGLTQLKYLNLTYNEIRDVTPLAGLTQLETLHLDGNQVDITPLAGLTQLEYLNLYFNEIRDVTPLAGLTQLTTLGLIDNEIRDVTPLAGLTQLEYLILDKNQISDVKPLAGLTQLERLNLRDNQISDVTPIQHLIDSASTQVLLEGNPIDWDFDLVIETFQANYIKSIKAVRSSGPGPGEEVSSILPRQKFDLYATVRNQGTQKSVKTRLKFYRSTDEDISPTDDTLLKAFSIKALPADGTAEVSFRVTAPKTTRIYYYYACVDSVDNEEKPDNNCTAALEIRVRNMKPDLVVHVIKSEDATYKHIFENTADIYANVDLSETEPASKPSFKFRVIVKNQGDRKSDPTELQLYYASNNDVSEKGKLLKAYQIKKIPSLEPNQVSQQTWTISLPYGGYHYYGAKVKGGVYESDSGNNWSVPVKVHAVARDLEPPENLISDVALTPNATYFVVNAQFPRLKNQNHATYGSCVITLGIPGVPNAPLDKWDPTDSLLTGDPPYFMFPLLSAQQRIDALEGTYNLDTTEVVIGAIGTAVGVGTGITALRYIPVIPLGKVGQSIEELAKVVLRIGSKFKVLIPTVAKVTVEGTSGAVGRYVVSKVIGKTTNFLTATGLRTVSNLTGGDEEEPSIEDELLAFTANPILILVPPSGQKTRPQGEDRYLFRIPKQLTEIDITVEQVYFVGENAFTAKYQGVYPLEGAAAAPGLAPMSLSDYLPFQWLSPEAQAYLLRDFGVFTSAETWQIPVTTALLPNYPNPFNPETWIPYQLAEAADVRLTLYDIYGRVVRDLDLGHQRAGVYQSRSRAAYWDGKNAQGEPVASGIYFYTLKAGDFTTTRKMLIRK